MDEYTKLLYSLAGIAVTGYIGWSVVSIIDLKGRVIKLEAKGDDIKEIKEDLKNLSSVVWEIAGKLGVPIRRD